MPTFKELGEQGFLDRVGQWTSIRNPRVITGIGDDALVLHNGIVVSSDSYANNLHFSTLYFSPEDIGYKSAGASISDLAAMGAEPICLLVNLFVPPDFDLTFLKRVYEGMEAVCAPLKCEIAGGDTVASDNLILSLTAIGEAKRPFLRSGAVPGDLLYLSGFPGLSTVGQRLLAMRRKLDGFSDAIERHLRPEPRVDLGIKLRAKVSACMDVSDGISTDACRLARSSAVKLIVEHTLLPKHPDLISYIERFGENWDSLVLNGGEDYELLFTAKASTKLPSEMASLSIHRIGRIEKGHGAFLEINGELKPLHPRGWDHFSV